MASLPSSAAAPRLADVAPHRGVAALLLNLAHTLDHLMLLVFATAVGAIAADFGLPGWESLMPYTTGAFVMFGLVALPAGRLGDLWGRRSMMLVFFFGLGASALLVALARGPWELAAALTLLGVFAAIYHPVGIPMLVQRADRPGWVIGVNGLAGNLGIALAALSTGLLVKHFGWRAAYAVPGVVAILLGIAFLRFAPQESSPPAQRAPRQIELAPSVVARVLAVLTVTSTCSGLVFNFTTNGNGELLRERIAALAADPALLGVVLALVYVVASLAQLVVGRAIDRHPLDRLFAGIVAAQVPLFALAVVAHGWALYAVAIAFMALVFGSIPFTDAIIVRYVDDRQRSRVAGIRFAIAFGASSAAVYLLGPLVRHAGFSILLATLAGIAGLMLVAIAFLPRSR